MGWLTTRTDDQILEDAMEIVDALETTAYTGNITKIGEEIMIDVVELCTLLLRNDITRRDNCNKGVSGEGEFIECLEYHECDDVKLDLMESSIAEDQTCVGVGNIERVGSVSTKVGEMEVGPGVECKETDAE